MLNNIANIPDKVYYLYGVTKGSFYCGSRYDAGTSKHFHYTRVLKNAVINSVLSGNTKQCKQMNNTPITDVYILNNRMVVVNGNYVVDVDNDFVTEAILNSTINKGKIASQFIWCLIGSKIKLVRVGSSLYNQVLESSRRTKLPKIKKKNFEVGGLYSTPTGRTEIYLGNINTETMIYDYKNKKNEVREIKNQHLFYRIRTKGDFDIKDLLEDPRYYDLNIKNSHSFVEKVKHFNVNKDIIAKLRNAAIEKIKQFIINHPTNRDWIFSEYRYNSYLINMHQVKDPPPAKFDIEKYLTFI